MLDLNHLLHRHQISLMRASDADCTEARLSHEGLASLYAERIAELSEQTGAGIGIS